MIEFFDRLVGPIDTDGVRIYRRSYEKFHHESHYIYEA